MVIIIYDSVGDVGGGWGLGGEEEPPGGHPQGRQGHCSDRQGRQVPWLGP